LVDLALLDRRLHQADHAQAGLVAALHGGLHVVGEALLEAHRVTPFPWNTKSRRRSRVPASRCELDRGARRRRQAGSVHPLALGDVARGATRLALHRRGGLALALLGRLLVKLALAGLGQHAGLFAGALEAAQGKLERLAFADFDARSDERRVGLETRAA